ncbi:MAG: VOC family protein [Betaproteobacteria bacterium]|nr:VOC family protein [Betaproteobacteria bacterium]
MSASSSPPLNIDHVAHFVPESEAAATALTQLGFTLTPFSAQSHRTEAGGPLVPAGTGNRCVMLRQGYVEFLTPTHDTPNAQQLRTAIARYTGVHLIAFGTSTPHEDHARLEREGFTPLPPIALQREAQTIDGTATARFTVVRVPPAVMAEGRIQFCQHHTPRVVWQPRWLDHANHAVGLAGALLCVADPAAAAQRYARFSGLPAVQRGNVWRLDSARGCLWLMDAASLRETWGAVAPTLPWIAGYVIDSDDMRITAMQVNGTRHGERIAVVLPPALGGVIVFQAAGSAPWA